MDNNNKLRNAEAETVKPMPAANNSNADAVAEEIVIYDECGDTMWDKVLLQKPFLDIKTNENTGTTTR